MATCGMSASGGVGLQEQPTQRPIPPGSTPQIEAFLSENTVDVQAANRLRTLPAHMQRLVLMRGGLSLARDPSSVMMSRIREAMTVGGGATGVMMPGVAAGGSQQ